MSNFSTMLRIAFSCFLQLVSELTSSGFVLPTVLLRIASVWKIALYSSQVTQSIAEAAWASEPPRTAAPAIRVINRFDLNVRILSLLDCVPELLPGMTPIQHSLTLDRARPG